MILRPNIMNFSLEVKALEKGEALM